MCIDSDMVSSFIIIYVANMHNIKNPIKNGNMHKILHLKNENICFSITNQLPYNHITKKSTQYYDRHTNIETGWWSVNVPHIKQIPRLLIPSKQIFTVGLESCKWRVSK